MQKRLLPCHTTGPVILRITGPVAFSVYRIRVEICAKMWYTAMEPLPL